jgi:hypothetical protein
MVAVDETKVNAGRADPGSGDDASYLLILVEDHNQCHKRVRNRL